MNSVCSKDYVSSDNIGNGGFNVCCGGVYSSSGSGGVFIVVMLMVAGVE